jgi:hypothetical protein
MELGKEQADIEYEAGMAIHLAGKSEITLELFECLINNFQQIGTVTVHPAKSMICFSSRRNFAYVIQLGSNFVDLVLPFKEAYEDNLCFRKIKPVPGSNDFNHHVRIFSKEDFNEELMEYVKRAYLLAK